MKRCNGCKEALPLGDFANMSASPDGKQYKCKRCVRAYKIKWEAENIDRLRIQRRNGDIRRYGIEPEDYDRMLAEQGGLCAGCLKPEPTPGHSLHIDHCHESGRVRGLLCGRCNRALGMVADDVVVLKRLIDYLHANSPSTTCVIEV